MEGVFKIDLARKGFYDTIQLEFGIERFLNGHGGWDDAKYFPSKGVVNLRSVFR